MKVLSIPFGRLIKAIFTMLLFIVPLLANSAQNSGAASPSGTMSGPASSAPPSAGPPPVEGLIVSIEGSTLVLTGPIGTGARVLVGKDTLILARQIATLASIRPGDALGVAAARADDGSLTATAINIFPPELWQRVRKGQFPMVSGQIMTNAEVDRVTDRVEGRTIYLKYDMLTATIAVPASAEIHRSVAMKLADLRTGMKVTIRMSPSTDGSLHAAFINLDRPAG